MKRITNRRVTYPDGSVHWYMTRVVLVGGRNQHLSHAVCLPPSARARGRLACSLMLRLGRYRLQRAVRSVVNY